MLEKINSKRNIEEIEKITLNLVLDVVHLFLTRVSQTQRDIAGFVKGQLATEN